MRNLKPDSEQEKSFLLPQPELNVSAFPILTASFFLVSILDAYAFACRVLSGPGNVEFPVAQFTYEQSSDPCL